MDELKNKSDLNFASAKLLMDNTYYAPSVHCSYYSVLQLMKFTVSYSLNTSYENQDKEINRLKQNRASAKGTHEYLIYKIGEKIREIKKQDYSDFTRKIKDLKNWRIKGDYDSVAITFDQSRKAVGLADELRKQLKNTFKV